MKNFASVFSFLFLAINFMFVSNSMGAGFSLDDALIELDIATDRPQYLAGVEANTQFDSSELQGDASDLTKFIEKVAKSLTGAAAAIAIIMIVFNSISLVTSAGDSDAISNAKKGLLWAFLGLLLIVFAYVIIKNIIAMTYVGETGEPTIVEQTEVTSSNCSAPTNITIPPASFGTDDSNLSETQNRNDNSPDFPAELFNYGMGSTGNEVQDFLKNKGYYDGLPSGCEIDITDGKYGQCTMKALQAYNEDLTKKYKDCLAAEQQVEKMEIKNEDRGDDVEAVGDWSTWEGDE